ncbi:unnamed protein product [Ambrosiozyma monospora]|uniref:Unnamed protein product n=1 Tax=Ambrosiozyma monospora TaxID=43982 RepID=A0ACB5U3Q7_AMBMO|nr:unnamed protein product [Ambrosiozyma monospora]
MLSAEYPSVPKTIFDDLFIDPYETVIKAPKPRRLTKDSPFTDCLEPKSKVEHDHGIRVVGHYGSGSDFESKDSYYPNSALLETIPLPNPGKFYDA